MAPEQKPVLLYTLVTQVWLGVVAAVIRQRLIGTAQASTFRVGAANVHSNSKGKRDERVPQLSTVESAVSVLLGSGNGRNDDGRL